MFLTLDDSSWTAIGTVAIAVATLILAIVTVWLSAVDRHTAERLRRTERDETERRLQAERREHEDFEARQVVIHAENHLTVSTPISYPVRRVEGCTASLAGPGILSTRPWNYPVPNDPRVEGDRTLYVFKAHIEPPEKPIIRFVDWHGNLYYQYRGYTYRAGQDDDWDRALTWFSDFLRKGPGGRVSG